MKGGVFRSHGRTKCDVILSKTNWTGTLVKLVIIVYNVNMMNKEKVIESAFFPRDNLIYLAGIVDGEGCIYLQTQTINRVRYRTFRLSVTNTNLELIEWLGDNFGGYVYIKKLRNPSYKKCYDWRIGGAKAM